jgi:hypothetical protein
MASDKPANTYGKVFGVKELTDDLGEIGIRPKFDRYEIYVRMKDDEGGYGPELAVDMIARHGGVLDDFDLRLEARRRRDRRLDEINAAIQRIDHPD